MGVSVAADEEKDVAQLPAAVTAAAEASQREGSFPPARAAPPPYPGSSGPAVGGSFPGSS